MNPVDDYCGDKLLLTTRTRRRKSAGRPLQLGLAGIVNDDSNVMLEKFMVSVWFMAVASRGQEINVTETDTLSG